MDTRATIHIEENATPEGLDFNGQGECGQACRGTAEKKEYIEEVENKERRIGFEG
ncbi:hypothetical protein Sjap_014122 [Stephania japonica]|uniref:Uncharacterized protein n=1 Tax=Stephania japonica TaxID=461633 RepID=A0AAP0J007_9MAGN